MRRLATSLRKTAMRGGPDPYSLSTALLFCTAGCYDVLDARDYHVDRTPTASPPAELPIERFERPHKQGGTTMYDATCMACLEANCRAELVACEADPECKELFAEARSCVDPSCWVDLSIEYGHFGTASWLLHPLDNCQEEWCGNECRLGRNFDCVGHYSWTVRYELDAWIDLDVLAWAGAPIDGARVDACLGNTCYQGETLSMGHASLFVPAHPTGFLGYLEARHEDVPSLLPARLMSNQPFLDGMRGITQIDLLWQTEIDDILMNLGAAPFDAELGYAGILTYDCHNWPARDVDVELEGVPANQVFYNEDLDPWVAIIDVLPGERTLTVRDAETGAVVVRARVDIAAGITWAQLFPNTFLQAKGEDR